MVWCGPGVGLVGVVPPFPPVEWCAPAFFGLLWVFGILIPMMMIMMMMMMGTMITIIINSSILMFDWLVVGCLLPTCLVFIALLIVGPLPRDSCRFGGNCQRVAIGQLSQGSGLSGNAVLVTVTLFILWEVPTVTRIGRVWDAILVTVDGFGGLTCESCRKN